MTVSRKIIAEWGTIKHFCNKNDINYSTMKQVLYNNATSAPIVAKLKKHKIIKNATELKKKSA